MADEETIVSGTDTSAASQNSNTGPTVEDLRSQLLEAQQRATKSEQKAAQLEKTLDELQPYVTDSSGVSDPAPKTPVASKPPQEDGEIKRLKAELESTKAMFGEVTTSNFYDANPDLNEHKDFVLTAFHQTDPNKPLSTRLKEAASKVREKVKKIEEAAIAKVQAEKDVKKKAAAATAGVVESGSTAPETPEPSETWGQSDYAAQRRREQIS